MSVETNGAADGVIEMAGTLDEAASLSCRELSRRLLTDCADQMIGTLSQTKEYVYATAESATEVGREAQYWQIFAFTLMAGSLIYNHGRW
jgi:hypothetical protein